MKRTTSLAALALLVASCGASDQQPTETTPAVPADSTQTTQPSSSEQSSEDGAEIVEIVWQAHATPVYTPEFWDMVLERFHAKHPNIRVSRVMAPDTNADQFVRTLIAGESMPDVVMSINTSDFVDALLPLEIDDDVRRVRNYEAVLIDGKAYSYGAALVPESLVFYNQDMFEEAGISAPPSTIEEMEAAMEALQGIGTTPMVLAGEWVPGRHFVSFFIGPNVLKEYPDYYTRWLDDELSMASSGNTGWLDGAELLQSWVDRGFIEAGGLGDGYQQGEENFLTGRGALYPMGVWFTGVLASNPPDFEVGVFAMPTLSGSSVLSARFGRPAISVAKETEHPEEAVLFAKYLAFDEWAHPTITQRDGLVSDLDPPATFEMTEIQQVIFEITNTHEHAPTYAGWGDSVPPPGFVNEVNAVIQEMILGLITPEEAMDRLDAFRDS